MQESREESKIEMIEGALTRAEEKQIIAQKRDRLYNLTLRAAIVFSICVAALLTGFKMNEDFFDANSRIGILMGSVNAQESVSAYKKINVKAQFRDEKNARLVIPLTASLDAQNVSIREEFTRNKYVITLSGYSENIRDGVELVSDSDIMDAVGVYRQDHDVVVEVYCRDIYDYALTVGGNELTVNFEKLGDQYAAKAVVWFPYDDRNRLALPEWRQRLEEFAADNKLRLFMASDMQEEYTQSEVIAFANRIGADLVLGVQVEAENCQQSYIMGICNTSYFIPEFNSAGLAVMMAENFVSRTELDIHGFEEADSNEPLVSEATVPSAMVKIVLTQKDKNSVENTYKLNERILTALEDTMGGVVVQTAEKWREINYEGR